VSDWASLGWVSLGAAKGLENTALIFSFAAGVKGDIGAEIDTLGAAGFLARKIVKRQ
jgi:hypothetical protein